MGTATRAGNLCPSRGTVWAPLWDGRQWWDGREIVVRIEDVHEFLTQHRLRFVSKFDPYGTGFNVEVGNDDDGESRQDDF